VASISSTVVGNLIAIWFGPPGLLWDNKDENGVPILNEKYKTMDKAKLDKLQISDNMMAGSIVHLDECHV